MRKSIFPQKIQKSLCLTTKTCNFFSNFKRNYLENYNDSEHAVKTKNAPFFMNFPNIDKIGNFFPPLDWSLNSYLLFRWSFTTNGSIFRINLHATVGHRR